MSEFQKNQAAKILSAYSNIFDIIKSHIELEQYHRYGKILFRKRSKRDNSFIYHSTIAADTKNFTKIKEIKQKIAENGHKNEEVKIIYHTLTPNVIRVDINWSDAIHDSAVQKFDLIENKILHGLNKEIIKLLMENKNCIKVDIDNSPNLKRITAKAVIYLQPIEQ